jgi:hypothetical protein
MLTAFLAFGISLAASLLAVLFLGTFRVLWNWWLQDVWVKLTYRHVTDIAGRWDAEYQDIHGNQIREEMHLYQFGWRIRGEVSYHVRLPAGKASDKTFCVEGIFRNDLLSAYYWNKDRRQRGSGTFTLTLIEQGNVFDGCYAWYDVVSSKVDCGQYRWNRAQI